MICLAARSGTAPSSALATLDAHPAIVSRHDQDEPVAHAAPLADLPGLHRRAARRWQCLRAGGLDQQQHDLRADARPRTRPALLPSPPRWVSDNRPAGRSPGRSAPGWAQVPGPLRCPDPTAAPGHPTIPATRRRCAWRGAWRSRGFGPGSARTLIRASDHQRDAAGGRRCGCRQAGAAVPVPAAGLSKLTVGGMR